jgi:hypothetical protein
LNSPCPIAPCVIPVTQLMTTIAHTRLEPAWLLFIFTLPTKGASQRVDTWRKLRRYGALALKSGGHVLPNTPANRERFEWLGAVIRKSAGHASVMQVHSLDDHSDARLRELFLEASTREYEAIIAELRKITRRHGDGKALARFRRKLRDIIEIDFFHNPLRSRLETLLARAEERDTAGPSSRSDLKKKEYSGRIWVTRPRPGIDRVSSAWLIRKFIDTSARFIFDNDPSPHPAAVPFDMFQTNQGFGHRGDDCTFETLCKEFVIRDQRVRVMAQIIHDADLEDGKFGRTEGVGIDRTLIGWAKQGVSDEELLRRGMEMIEGLYDSVS